jgi:hypothetical protein
MFLITSRVIHHVPSSVIQHVPSGVISEWSNSFLYSQFLLEWSNMFPITSRVIHHVPSSVIQHVPSGVIHHVPSRVIHHVPSRVIHHVPSRVIHHVPSSVIQHVPSGVIQHVSNSFQCDQWLSNVFPSLSFSKKSLPYVNCNWFIRQIMGRHQCFSTQVYPELLFFYGRGFDIFLNGVHTGSER